MTQSVECLPCNHKDLSLSSRTCIIKSNAMVNVIISVLGRQTDGFLGFTGTSLVELMSSRPMRVPVSKSKMHSN